MEAGKAEMSSMSSERKMTSMTVEASSSSEVKASSSITALASMSASASQKATVNICVPHMFLCFSSVLLCVTHVAQVIFVGYVTLCYLSQ